LLQDMPQLLLEFVRSPGGETVNHPQQWSRPENANNRHRYHRSGHQSSDSLTEGTVECWFE